MSPPFLWEIFYHIRPRLSRSNDAQSNYSAAVAFGEEAINPSGETSSQVVGYVTTHCEKGKWYLIASQFEQTSGGEMKLVDFIKGNFVGQAANAATKPHIMVWDTAEAAGTGGYIDYYYINNLRTSLPDDGSTIGWATSRTTYDKNITIPLGASVWFIDENEDCDITVAGQVAAVSDKKVPVVENTWNLIANPFPKALLINKDIDWKNPDLGFVGGPNTEAGRPHIMVWDITEAAGTGGYIDYYYWNNLRTNVPSDGTIIGWATSRTTYTEDLSVPVGAGFWLQYSTGFGPASGEITFSK